MLIALLILLICELCIHRNENVHSKLYHHQQLPFVWFLHYVSIQRGYTDSYKSNKNKYTHTSLDIYCIVWRRCAWGVRTTLLLVHVIGLKQIKFKYLRHTLKLLYTRERDFYFLLVPTRVRNTQDDDREKEKEREREHKKICTHVNYILCVCTDTRPRYTKKKPEKQFTT